MNENDKQMIDEFLKQQGFEFKQYDDFIDYITRRGMLNESVGITSKIFFTKPNLSVLYSEFINPIKRVSKLLKLTYKELSKLTGYTEGAFKSAISKGEISEPMRQSLFMLLQIDKLQSQLLQKDEKIVNLKRVLSDTLKDQ